jgi:hypothetical protein
MLLGLVMTLGACMDKAPGPAVGMVDPAHDCEPRAHALVFAETQAHEVDLLFVIDNSISMGDEQSLLQANFPALIQELRDMEGGLPDVHIGVISTDLGSGMFDVGFCQGLGGDHGSLQTGSCANPLGASYVVDVQPAGCAITRDPEGDQASCLSHDCSADNCALEPTSSLIEDEHGCPRCVNYEHESLEEVFSCIANLGVSGCGFEQPLEAMYRALDDNPNNAGFLRDEDDCSAASDTLFDNTQTGLNDTLGPLSSFRCFEFGVSCDINSRTHQGLRQDCHPRDDPAAFLHPIHRYTELLGALRDPGQLTVAAIAGPAADGAVTVGMDEYGQPAVLPSCISGPDGAAPGIRLRAFVEAFNEPAAMSWAYTSICEPDYRGALQGIGVEIRTLLEAKCLPLPLLGCADVGAEFGMHGDAETCNDVCQANCEVTDVRERGTPYEEQYAVPPCLEICDSGPCPGNTNRDYAYAEGHPADRAEGLPVESCWHIAFNAACQASQAAELVVSRRADPPPRSFIDVACELIPAQEECCWDGEDNDGDCLTDQDDPDCSSLIE